MKTLFDVALAHNTEVFVDTYGSATFLGQMMLFAEAVRSSASAERRILEVGPDVVIPSQRVVTDVASGQVFIVASPEYDWWKGRVITIKFPVIPVTSQFFVQSPEQVLLNYGGYYGVYMAPSYIRKVALDEQSEYFAEYSLLYSSFYELPTGVIVSDGSTWYRTREASRIDDVGFGTSEAVELPNPIVNQDIFINSAYSATTDSNTITTLAQIKTFSEPIVLNFKHEVLGYIKPEVGDLAVTVLKSAAPLLKKGDRIGSHGLILAVESVGGTFVCHVRRNQ
jgi:hypothetical protein